MLPLRAVPEGGQGGGAGRGHVRDHAWGLLTACAGARHATPVSCRKAASAASRVGKKCEESIVRVSSSWVGRTRQRVRAVPSGRGSRRIRTPSAQPRVRVSRNTCAERKRGRRGNCAKAQRRSCARFNGPPVILTADNGKGLARSGTGTLIFCASIDCAPNISANRAAPKNNLFLVALILRFSSDRIVYWDTGTLGPQASSPAAAIQVSLDFSGRRGRLRFQCPSINTTL